MYALNVREETVPFDAGEALDTSFLPVKELYELPDEPFVVLPNVAILKCLLVNSAGNKTCCYVICYIGFCTLKDEVGISSMGVATRHCFPGRTVLVIDL